MSLTLYTSIGWAVEKQIVASGGGLTGPVLVSAVSTDPNTVRLTFDRKLMLEYRQNGVYHAETLDLTSYRIISVVDSSVLEVVRVLWVDDTHIDLLTANQQEVIYRVTCVAGGVMDCQGNTITEQTADFTGQQRTTYTTPSNIRVFTSGYSGMQEGLSSDFYPDLEAPFLQNRNPAPDDIDIDPAANLYLEIRDTGEGVDLSTVRLWVQGNLAYRGDTNTFLPPFDGPSSAVVHVGDTYQVTLDRTTSFDDYLLVSIRVLASDLVPIPNTLDTTYSFRTGDYSGPSITAYAPAGTNVSKNTLVSLSIRDVGAGVDIGSLSIDIGGMSALSGMTFQSGFDGPNSQIIPVPGGYDIIIQKTIAYDSYELVGVNVYVEDAMDNITSFSWDFRIQDFLGPFVHPIDPSIGETNVPTNTNITVEVTDDQSVNPGSVRVRIDRGSGWEVAYQQGDTPAFKPGYDGPESEAVSISGGYRVTIDPTTDFEVSTLVKVEVSAADPEGNPERLG